jgi:peptidoglycan/LPS O-acetylase OafA/YrhL
MALTIISKTRNLTLLERWEVTKGRPSGFDYMRLVLALGVIVAHSGLLVYGEHGSGGKWDAGVIVVMIVPMFFALSGFLVAGSLERTKTMLTFLGLRVLRIMPALAVEVFLSALVLGPLLTTFSVAAYFSDVQFRAYFLNILGDIHYTLPGVFQSNPNTLVNGQLWTVPYELICYIVLSFLAVSGLFKRRHWLVLLLGVYYIAQVGNTILRTNHEVKVAGGSSAVMAFIAGLILYRYRDKLKWSFQLFGLALLVSVILCFVPNGVRFIALPAAYVTVYLGLCNLPRDRLLLSGDYSYGLYLYGYPIQQAVVALGRTTLNQWWLNLAFALPLSILVAIGSWWLVEKPALRLRAKLKDIETWYLQLSPLFSAERIPTRDKTDA